MTAKDLIAFFDQSSYRHEATSLSLKKISDLFFLLSLFLFPEGVDAQNNNTNSDDNHDANYYVALAGTPVILLLLCWFIWLNNCREQEVYVGGFMEGERPAMDRETINEEEIFFEKEKLLPRVNRFTGYGAVKKMQNPPASEIEANDPKEDYYLKKLDKF